MKERVERGFRKMIFFGILLYGRSTSSLLVVLFGRGCRFQPTCSEYFCEAVLKKGVFRGTIAGAGRFLRCHPFGRSGWDPVK
jgi:putative membrane protein insertion efficiency factor